MSNGEQRPQPQAGSDPLAQDQVDAELPPRETARSVPEARPAWLDQFVWSVLWKLVAVSLATVLLLLVVRELGHLLLLLVVSSFIAIAMVPGVDQLHRRWGRRRGAAVGIIYGSVVLFIVLMVWVLIPAIEEFANQVRANGSGWIDQLNDLSRQWLGKDLVGDEAGDRAAVVTRDSLRGWSDNILGLASSGVGILFDVTVVAMFAFYFAADYPRIERAVLSRLRPDRQQAYAWLTEVSIRQTGGYFYSRLLLTLINASLGVLRHADPGTAANVRPSTCSLHGLLLPVHPRDRDLHRRRYPDPHCPRGPGPGKGGRTPCLGAAVPVGREHTAQPTAVGQDHGAQRRGGLRSRAGRCRRGGAHGCLHGAALRGSDHRPGEEQRQAVRGGLPVPVWRCPGTQRDTRWSRQLADNRRAGGPATSKVRLENSAAPNDRPIELALGNSRRTARACPPTSNSPHHPGCLVGI